MEEAYVFVWYMLCRIQQNRSFRTVVAKSVCLNRTGHACSLGEPSIAISGQSIDLSSLSCQMQSPPSHLEKLGLLNSLQGFDLVEGLRGSCRPP